MNIVHIADITALTTLLSECSLPVSDLKLNEHCQFFGSYGGAHLEACVGVELLASAALLRSLAVAPSKRNSGYGALLVTHAEAFIRSKHIQSIYLLTTTASDYFTLMGYSLCSRDDVPAAIKATSQYSLVCPDSATVLCKQITIS